MRYILADNQELTRFAFESIITRNDNNIVYIANNKAELVQLLAQNEKAIVVLDYSMFDISDEEQLLIISERFELSQWILISNELTISFMRRIIYSSHRFSIVFKDSALKEIKKALDAAIEQEFYVCPRAMEAIIQYKTEEKPEKLTSTEIEIVRAIAQGKTTKEIATERFSSIHTITTHRKNIFRKLQVNTAREVIKYAIRAGLVDSSEFYI